MMAPPTLKQVWKQVGTDQMTPETLDRLKGGSITKYMYNEASVTTKATSALSKWVLCYHTIFTERAERS